MFDATTQPVGAIDGLLRY